MVQACAAGVTRTSAARIEPALRQSPGYGRLASLGLVAVLFALPGFAIWSAVAAHWAGGAARHATELSDAYEEARYAVGAEESLERKYRLEPGTEVRARHRAAGEAMAAALQHARTLGGTADAELVDDVLARHVVYLSAIDHMFAAVDAGDTALSNEIDEHEVDPAFDAIETRVVAAAAEHRASAARHLADLAAIQQGVLVATPLVFAAGLALVVFFVVVLRSYRTRAADAVAREAASLRDSEQRFRALVQNTSDVVLTCAPDGTVTYQSPAAETVWGCAPGELLGRPLADLLHPDDRAAAGTVCDQVKRSAGATATVELRRGGMPADEGHIELILTNLLHEPGVRGLVATARAIDERKAFERQLTHQAFYDSLTGLPNRALFHDRLAQALVRTGRRSASVGLLFLDLDNFKLVNDSLGHETGDKLLLAAAKRLQACVRTEDTVARLGGDEFVVLLEHLAGPADAQLAAEMVEKQFARPFRIEGRDMVVTASIGVALGDAGQENDAESLLRNADVAMYRAKSNGKGAHVLFDASMRTDSLARLELEADLRQALERGELEVHYQPIVLLGSSRLSEVEALVRWRHPTRGLVSPADFIPIAEDTGIILPLGQWVLEQACRQTAAWQAESGAASPLTISVNLSPRQFQMPNLVEEVTRTLRETGLPAASLKLEITEGSIMRDVEATVTTLWQLKDLGIQIAVDDFGTGYSSLSYLKRLPLDVLKIDRSFVKGISDNQEDAAIVRAIISLGKSLGLAITGEGVESEEQAALLGSWACDRGQGYLWSKPVTAEGIAKLLEASSQANDQQVREDLAAAA